MVNRPGLLGLLRGKTVKGQRTLRLFYDIN